MAELVRNLSADEIQSPDNATLLISDQCRVNIANDHAQHILHFELPYNVNNYQQRLKRHQKEQNNSAIILADGRDYNALKTIEKILGSSLEQQVVPGLEPLKPFVSQRPAKQRTNTNNRKPLTQQNKNNRRRPQDNKTKGKKRLRKGGLHGRFDGVGQRKRNPLRNSPSASNENWQSDFVEPKERTVKAKRVVIRYKDSKKTLLK
jgi:hypothetical protein